MHPLYDYAIEQARHVQMTEGEPRDPANQPGLWQRASGMPRNYPRDGPPPGRSAAAKLVSMRPSDADVFGSKPPLCYAESEVPIHSALNAINLVDYVTGLAKEWQGSGCHFTPAIVCEANRVSLDGIFAFAGSYRNRFVSVSARPSELAENAHSG